MEIPQEILEKIYPLFKEGINCVLFLKGGKKHLKRLNINVLSQDLQEILFALAEDMKIDKKLISVHIGIEGEKNNEF